MVRSTQLVNNHSREGTDGQPRMPLLDRPTPHREQSMADTGISGPSDFRLTSWALLDHLKDDRTREPAMDALIQRYWRPTYLFLRKKGYGRDDAMDWTQEFFARAFEHRWFERARQRKGRFRTFLLTALTRFVRDSQQRAQARFERRFRPAILGAGPDDEGILEPRDDETPDDAFMRQWARDVVARALEILRKECASTADEWAVAVFQERVQATAEGREVTWDELARRHGKSRAQVRYAFDKIHKRAKRIVRDLLVEDGGDPDPDLTGLT